MIAHARQIVRRLQKAESEPLSDRLTHTPTMEASLDDDNHAAEPRHHRGTGSR